MQAAAGATYGLRPRALPGGGCHSLPALRGQLAEAEARGMCCDVLPRGSIGIELGSVFPSASLCRNEAGWELTETAGWLYCRGRRAWQCSRLWRRWGVQRCGEDVQKQVVAGRRWRR